MVGKANTRSPSPASMDGITTRYYTQKVIPWTLVGSSGMSFAPGDCFRGEFC